jgi:glycosyltransferase involved in cell wall biosynthesis
MSNISRPEVATVIFLNDYCSVNGGASRIAIDEAVALAERGERVIFLGATGPIGPELAASRVETICLDQPELISVSANPSVVIQGLWNRRAARVMSGLLGDLDRRRTVVHLHGYTKSLTTSPVRAASRMGFPILCTLHDFFAACPNGAFFDYVANRPCPKKALSLDCVATNCDKRRYHHKLFRVARGALQRWPGLLPSGVHDYIGLSRHSVALMRPYLPTDAHIHPLENIIDMRQRPPVAIDPAGAVVAVGRLDPEKGVRLLLEAAKRTGTSITFVGDGPLRGEVEAAGGHRVTGWLSPAQVEAELDRARCLVFPSLWYETFGLVVSEAAGRGIAAIVSDISAAAERVRHGETGLVFTSGDVAALAACLDAAKDADRLRTMGGDAYQAFWVDPPTRDSHIAKLVDIYSRVLENFEPLTVEGPRT